MSGYGKEGNTYRVGDDEFAVNEKFLTATSMATILVLMELFDGEATSNAIESLATAIYDNLQEVGHAAPEGTVGDTGETAD